MASGARAGLSVNGPAGKAHISIGVAWTAFEVALDQM